MAFLFCLYKQSWGPELLTLVFSFHRIKKQNQTKPSKDVCLEAVHLQQVGFQAAEGEIQHEALPGPEPRQCGGALGVSGRAYPCPSSASCSGPTSQTREASGRPRVAVQPLPPLTPRRHPGLNTGCSAPALPSVKSKRTPSPETVTSVRAGWGLMGVLVPPGHQEGRIYVFPALTLCGVRDGDTVYPRPPLWSLTSILALLSLGPAQHSRVLLRLRAHHPTAPFRQLLMASASGEWKFFILRDQVPVTLALGLGVFSRSIWNSLRIRTISFFPRTSLTSSYPRLFFFLLLYPNFSALPLSIQVIKTSGHISVTPAMACPLRQPSLANKGTHCRLLVETLP